MAYCTFPCEKVFYEPGRNARYLTTFCNFFPRLNFGESTFSHSVTVLTPNPLISIFSINFRALKDLNRQKWCLHTDGYNYAISSFTAVPSEKISSTLKGPFSVRFRPTMFPKQRTEAFYLWRRLIWVYLIKWINFFIVLQCEKRQCLSPCVVLPSLNELGTNLPSFPGS